MWVDRLWWLCDVVPRRLFVSYDIHTYYRGKLYSGSGGDIFSHTIPLTTLSIEGSQHFLNISRTQEKL